VAITCSGRTKPGGRPILRQARLADWKSPRFWQHHPSLSYLFGNAFGSVPASQSTARLRMKAAQPPRSDAWPHTRNRSAAEGDQRQLISETLRPTSTPIAAANTPPQ